METEETESELRSEDSEPEPNSDISNTLRSKNVTRRRMRTGSDADSNSNPVNSEVQIQSAGQQLNEEDNTEANKSSSKGNSPKNSTPNFWQKLKNAVSPKWQTAKSAPQEDVQLRKVLSRHTRSADADQANKIIRNLSDDFANLDETTPGNDIDLENENQQRTENRATSTFCRETEENVSISSPIAGSSQSFHVDLLNKRIDTLLHNARLHNPNSPINERRKSIFSPVYGNTNSASWFETATPPKTYKPIPKPLTPRQLELTRQINKALNQFTTSTEQTQPNPPPRKWSSDSETDEESDIPPKPTQTAENNSEATEQGHPENSESTPDADRDSGENQNEEQANAHNSEGGNDIDNIEDNTADSNQREDDNEEEEENVSETEETIVDTEDDDEDEDNDEEHRQIKKIRIRGDIFDDTEDFILEEINFLKSTP
ncbi:unnamed protein product [Orchesella dallaii]|uniref:Uncharacterized protein n=1 Tax=Orchesella dallaii TaxID=48710 RepID=A0ABP1R8T1_9HEXA